jgi:hypothetical protein
MTHRGDRTLVTTGLARVEGEGSMYVRVADGRVEGKAGHLRTAAVLRGIPARPVVHRGAGHHGADLRHLPGRLPDQRLPGNRGRLRRGAARGPGQPAQAAVLRRVDLQPGPAHLHAARTGLPRVSGRGRSSRGRDPDTGYPRHRAACSTTVTSSTRSATSPAPGSSRPPRRTRPRTTCAGSSPSG